MQYNNEQSKRGKIPKCNETDCDKREQEMTANQIKGGECKSNKILNMLECTARERDIGTDEEREIIFVRMDNIIINYELFWAKGLTIFTHFSLAYARTMTI